MSSYQNYLFYGEFQAGSFPLSAFFGGIGWKFTNAEYIYRYFYDNIIFMLKCSSCVIFFSPSHQFHEWNGRERQWDTMKRNYKFSPNSNKTMAHWLVISLNSHENFIFIRTFLFGVESTNRFEGKSMRGFKLLREGKDLWLASNRFRWCGSFKVTNHDIFSVRNIGRIVVIWVK